MMNTNGKIKVVGVFAIILMILYLLRLDVAISWYFTSVGVGMQADEKRYV